MATLYVGTSEGYFSTINEAVAAAADGDIIIVKGSEYTLTDEKVTINKALTVKAEGDVTVDRFAVGSGSANPQNIAIEGFTVKPTAYSSTATAGIYQSGTNLTTLTVRDCTFDLTAPTAGTTGYGIHLDLNFSGTEKVTVDGCTFNGDGALVTSAMRASYQSSIEFTNNTVNDVSGHAVQMSLTGPTWEEFPADALVSFEGNTFNNIGSCAIYAADLKNNNTDYEVINNTITNAQLNGGSQYWGAIRFGSGGANSLTITGNTITNANVGIYQGCALKDGATGTIDISDNDFTLADRPVYGDASSTFSASALNVYDNVNGTVSAGDFTGNDAIYAEGADSILVDAALTGNAGELVVVDGKAYVIGTNAFTTVAKAVAEAKKINGHVTISINSGDYTEDVVLSGKTFTEDGKTYAGGITIQAVTGATVNYNGQIWLNSGATDIKDITIDGLNLTIAKKVNGYYAPIGIHANASVNASGIVITNNTIVSNATGDGVGTEGISFGWGVNVNGAVISNNTITADCGIYTEGGTNADMQVTGNTIYGREEKTTNSSHSGWAGIYITNVKDGVVISGNTVSDTAYVAIRTTNGGALITDNTIANVKDDRIVRLANGTVIEGNTIDGVDLATLFPAYEGNDIVVFGGIAAEVGTAIIDGVAYTVGTSAVKSFAEALTLVNDSTSKISIIGSLTEAGPASSTTVALNNSLTISGGDVTWSSLGGWVWFKKGDNAAEDVALVFDGVKFNATSAKKAFYFGTDVVIDGNSVVEVWNGKIYSDATVEVLAGSQFNVSTEALNIEGKLALTGKEDFKASEATLADRQTFIQYSQNVLGEIELENSYFASYQRIDLKSTAKLTADNSLLEFGTGKDGAWASNPVPNGYGDLNVSSADAVIELKNGSILKASADITNKGTIIVDNSTLIANGTAASNGVVTDARNTGVFTNEGTVTVSGESTLNISNLSGNIDIADGAVVKDTTINGGSVTLKGTAEFKGANTIGTLSLGYYNHKLIIGADSSLTTTSGRTTLSYGNTIDIDGTIEDAKTADKSAVVKSFDMGGFSFTGNGTYNGQDATLNVDNAYVSFGSSTSKNSSATGNFVWNFNNSIVDFTADFQTAASTKDGLDPHFYLNVTDSVFNVGTRFAFSHANSVAVVDNSVVTISQQFKNCGEFTLQNNSQMTVGSNADGPSYEKTGNFGTLTVTGAGTLFNTFAGTTANYPFYNKGTVNVADSAEFKADYVKNDGDIAITGGTVTATKITNAGNIVIADSELTLCPVENSGNVTLTGDVKANLNVTGNAVNADGADLGDSKLTANVLVNGDSTVSGNVAVSGVTKVANGAKLTIAEEGSFTGSFLAAGNDSYFGFGENAEDVKGGTIDIYGNVKVQQTNADGDGVVNVKTGAVLESAEFCVENGSLSDAATGVVNVEGTVKTASLRIFNGGTVNVAGTVEADHPDNVAAQQDINIWGGGTLNINGGTVNVAESMSVSEDGKLVINGGTLTVSQTLTNNGSDSIDVKGESTLNIKTLSGKSINLYDGAIIKDSTVGGALYVAGNVTFRGKNVINQITDFGTYYADEYGANAKWTVEKGASLELNTIYGLGYGDNANVIGSFTDAKAAYAAGLTKDDASFIVNSTFITQNNSAGKGTSNSFTVTDAYVRISMEGADQSFKNHAKDTYGQYQFTFTNSVMEMNSFKFTSSAEGTDGKYDFTITDSMFVTGGDFFFDDAESTFAVDNSVIKATGNAAHNATIGGALVLTNGSVFETAKAMTNSGSITIDATSTITAADITGAGSITINAEGFTGLKKVIDLSAADSLAGKVTVNGANAIFAEDGDVYITDAVTDTIYVNAAWNGMKTGEVTEEGYIYGYNAVASLGEISNKIATDGSDTTIKFLSDISSEKVVEFAYGEGDIIFTADAPVTIKQEILGSDWAFTQGYANTITIGKNVTFQIYDNASGLYVYYGPSLKIEGSVVGGQNWGCAYLFNGDHTVESTGTLAVGRVQVGFATLTVNGDASRTDAAVDTNYLLIEGGSFTATNAIIEAGAIHDSNNGGMRWGASSFKFVNSTVTANSVTLGYAGSTLNIADSVFSAAAVSNNGTIVVRGTSELNGSFTGNAVKFGAGANITSTSGVEFAFDINSTPDLVFGKGSYTMNGLYSYNDSSLTIAKDASVYVNGTFATKFNGTADIAEGAELSAGSIYFNGGSINVSGSLIARSGADGGFILNAEEGTVTVNAGALLDVSYVDSYKSAADSTVDVYGAAKVGFKMTDGSGKFTWNVYEGGSLDVVKHGIVINNAESVLNIAGTATATTVSNAGKINVNGGSFTAETVSGNGTVSVTGESTVNIATLSSGYVRFTDSTLVGDSVVGGNVRFFGDFVLDGTLNVKQSNTYGNTTVKAGAEFTGSTTIVGGNASFTLENGAKLASRFFNVLGTADINGEMTLTHSDPRQKVLQIHPDGVANINTGAVVTADGHNAWVSETGTLNINGGTLNITKWDSSKNDPAKGGILYNEGVTNVTAGKITGVRVENAGEINVTGGAAEFTGDVTLGEYVTISGFTAGEAREVQVAITREGETTGRTMTVSVAKNATSVTLFTQEFTDGTYNFTVIDGTGVFNTSAVVTNGKLTVADGTFAAGNLSVGNGTLSVSGNSTLNIGKVDATVKVASGSTLADTTVGGTVEMLGDLSFTGDAAVTTLKGTNGGDLTLEDGKTLALNNFSFGAKANADAEYTISGGKITANYGFFQHGTYTLKSDFETGYMYYSYGSTITVEGNFHSQGLGDGLDYVRGSLTIAESGSSIHDKSLWVGQPESWGAMNASMTVNGYVKANSISLYAGSTITVDGGKVEANKFESTGAFSVAGNVTLNVKDFKGDMTVADGTIFSDATSITVNGGSIVAEGDVTLKVNAITGAANFTAATVNFTGVELPTDQAITVYAGATKFDAMTINGYSVVQNQIYVDDVIYNVVTSDSAITIEKAEVVYEPISITVESITQTAGTYEFAFDLLVSGGNGEYIYDIVAKDAVTGAEIAGTTAGTAFTFTSAAQTNAVIFTVKVSDTFGQHTEMEIDSIAPVVDYTAPAVTDVTGTVDGDKLAITWNAADNFGVIGYTVAINGTEYSIIGGANTSFNYTASASGVYSYTVTAFDAAGNKYTTSSAEAELYVEMASAGVVLTQVNGEQAFTANAFVTGGKGAYSYAYSVTDADGNAVEFTVDGNKLVLADNTVKNVIVTVTVTDETGKELTVSGSSAVVDYVAPELTLSGNVTGWTKDDVAITAAASDNFGEYTIQYQIGSGEWQDGANAVVTGNTDVLFKVTDAAGNVTYSSVAVSNIDKTAPVSVINGLSDVWTAGTAELRISAVDDASGVASIEYSTDNETWTAVENGKVTVTENGKVYIKVTDAAGNVTVDSVDVANIDKTAPELTVSADKTYLTGSVNVTAAAVDAASGIASIKYSFNGSDWYDYTSSVKVTANTTVYISATDKVGNTVDTSIVVDNIADIKSSIMDNGFSQIVAWDAGRGAVGYIANAGTPGAEWQGVWEWNADEASMWKVVAVGNFGETLNDKDGILLYNAANSTFAAWTDLGSGDYGYKSLAYVDGSFSVKCIANLDGDGIDDVLIFDGGNFGAVLNATEYKDIWHVDGVQTHELVGAGYFGAADGLDSLVVKNLLSNSYELWHNDGDIRTTWAWSTQFVSAADSDWEIAAIGDFQGDGIDDIVMWQKSTGYMFAWEDGKAENTRWVGALDSNDWEVAAVGDYNGDGKEDLLLRELVTGWGGLGIWGGAYAGNWSDLNSRIENDNNGAKFGVIA